GGRRIDGLPAEQRQIGVAFQDAMLFPELTVLENVAVPWRGRGARRAAPRERASGGLDELARGVSREALPPTLSGGERQRVALARALGADPALLLLEGPFATSDA